MALELAERMGNAVETAIEVQGVAMAAAGSGAPARAIRLSAAADAAYVAVGFNFDVPWWAALVERYIGPARDTLGDCADDIAQGGRALGLEDAVNEALGRSSSVAGAV